MTDQRGVPSAGKDNSSQNQLEKEAPLAGSLADRNAAVPGRGFTDEVLPCPVNAGGVLV